MIGLYKEQLSYGAEIVELTELFFKKEAEYTEEAMDVLSQEHVPEMLANFKTQLDGLETFEADDIKAAIKATQKDTGNKGKKLFMPIRVATTAETHGPELPQAIHLLGKETVIHRLGKLIDELNNS